MDVVVSVRLPFTLKVLAEPVKVKEPPEKFVMVMSAHSAFTFMLTALFMALLSNIRRVPKLGRAVGVAGPVPPEEFAQFEVSFQLYGGPLLPTQYKGVCAVALLVVELFQPVPSTGEPRLTEL